jgi:hypothetical protein
MAGHRRQAGKPFHAEAAAERRRGLYVQRRGRARTAGQRVYAAADYLAGALADKALPAAAANALAATAASHLETLTRQAETEIARARRR